MLVAPRSVDPETIVTHFEQVVAGVTQ